MTNNAFKNSVPTTDTAAVPITAQDEKTKYEQAAETRGAIMSSTESAGPVLEANNAKRKDRPYTVTLKDGTMMTFN